MWQATSIVAAGSAGASMGIFCSVSDTFSVLWGEHFAQSTKELWDKAVHHPTPVGWVRADQPFDTIYFKNAASLTRQH